jgi:hypothetical protein
MDEGAILVRLMNILMHGKSEITNGRMLSCIRRGVVPVFGDIDCRREVPLRYQCRSTGWLRSKYRYQHG